MIPAPIHHDGCKIMVYPLWRRLYLALWAVAGFSLIHYCTLFFEPSTTSAAKFESSFAVFVPEKYTAYHVKPPQKKKLFVKIATNPELYSVGISAAYLTKYYVNATAGLRSSKLPTTYIDGLEILRGAAEMGVGLTKRQIAGCFITPAPFPPLTQARRPVSSRLSASILSRLSIDGRSEVIDTDAYEITGELEKVTPGQMRELIDSAKDRKPSERNKQVDKLLFDLLRRGSSASALRASSVVVIHSGGEPWYEAIAFAFGAADVTSLTNKPRSCSMSSLQFVTYAQATNCSVAFDVGFAISSVDSLGITDATHMVPEADLVAMQLLKRLIKPNGLLYFAVPMGADTIELGKRRIYGRYRWLVALAGWDIVDYVGVVEGVMDASLQASRQPVWLLRNAQGVA